MENIVIQLYPVRDLISIDGGIISLWSRHECGMHRSTTFECREMEELSAYQSQKIAELCQKQLSKIVFLKFFDFQ